ncbi:hypothetical protein D9M71_733110 [compost metagenome]
MLGDAEQHAAVPQVAALMEIGNEQLRQQGFQLRRIQQPGGPLQQPVGIAGVRHAANTREVDVFADHTGGGAYLRLALAHRLLAT